MENNNSSNKELIQSYNELSVKDIAKNINSFDINTARNLKIGLSNWSPQNEREAIMMKSLVHIFKSNAKHLDETCDEFLNTNHELYGSDRVDSVSQLYLQGRKKRAKKVYDDPDHELSFLLNEQEKIKQEIKQLKSKLPYTEIREEGYNYVPKI